MSYTGTLLFSTQTIVGFSSLTRALNRKKHSNKDVQATAYSVRCAPASERGSPPASVRRSNAQRHVGSLARALRGVFVTFRSWPYAYTVL